MKIIIRFVALISLVSIVLAACSSPNKTATQVPPVVSGTEVQNTLQATVEDGDVKMEELLVEKAAGNHTLEFILSQKLTRDQWDAMVDRMISVGAKISPEEKILIIDWLVSRN